MRGKGLLTTPNLTKDMANAQLSWETVCAFLQVVSTYRNNPYMKPKVITAFLERCIRREAKDAYQVFRLIFPESDTSRKSYRIHEHRLIYAILVAVESIKGDWPRDVSLFRWRDKDSLALALGEPRELSALLRERVFDHVCGTEGSLKVEDVNGMLDALANAHDDIDTHVDILRWFLERTTAVQMSWLVQVILKNVRSYISERDLLEAWGDDGVEKMYSRGWKLSDILDGDEGMDDDSVDQEGFVCGQEWYCQKPTYIRNIEDGHRYMERRFQYGSGALVVVGEAHVDGIAIQAHRHGGQIKVFSNTKVEKYDMALSSPLLQMIPEEKGDFVIEGNVVAWNTSKLCFEPRFVLDAILSRYGSISNGLESIDCPMYPSYKATQYADIDIIVLVSDVLCLGDEMLVHQALEIRLESLETHFKYVVFDRRGEEGFPLRVKVVPQIPNVSSIAGVLLSTKSSNVEELSRCKEDVGSLGANGITLRALETDWNSPDKFSHVVILKTLGKFVVNCAVMGAWKEESSGSVSHWLFGIQGPQGMINILKVKNDLHSRDMDEILSGIDFQGKDFYSFEHVKQQVIVMVAGSIVPAGTWNDTLALENPDILGISPSSSPSSVADIEEMILRRQDTMVSSSRYHVNFKGRSVPQMFLPCDLSKVQPMSSVLKDHIIYFSNYKEDPCGDGDQQYASRTRAKYSCEELVKKLGGTVSQNYTSNVAFVVAGHATRYTECFKNKNIPVLSVSWLKRLYQTLPEELPRISDGDYLPNWTCSKGNRNVDTVRVETTPRIRKELVRKERPESPHNTFSSLRGRFDAACSPQSPVKRPKPFLPVFEQPNFTTVSKAIEGKKDDTSVPIVVVEEGEKPAPIVEATVEKIASPVIDLTGPPPVSSSPAPGQTKKLSLKERAKLLRLG